VGVEGTGAGGGGGGGEKESNAKSFLIFPLKDKMMADFSYFFWRDHLSVFSKFREKLRFDGTANITTTTASN
jgi:hypothetical protein